MKELSKGEEAYCEIPLTRGYRARVDVVDYEILTAWKWYAKTDRNGKVYAARTGHGPEGQRPTIMMHRQILGIGDFKIKVDHRNHDTLDNRRANIRSCTNSENCRNRKIHANNSLGIKGVLFRYSSNRKKNFRATITVDGKQTSLGYFMTAEEAGRAYDEAAKKFHGEFANTNS